MPPVYVLTSLRLDGRQIQLIYMSVFYVHHPHVQPASMPLPLGWTSMRLVVSSAGLLPVPTPGEGRPTAAPPKDMNQPRRPRRIPIH